MVSEIFTFEIRVRVQKDPKITAGLKANGQNTKEKPEEEFQHFISKIKPVSKICLHKNEESIQQRFINTVPTRFYQPKNSTKA